MLFIIFTQKIRMRGYDTNYKKTKWIGDHAEFLIIMQGQNSVKQNHFGNISFNNETNYLGGKYLQLCFNYYLNGTTKKQWIIV